MGQRRKKLPPVREEDMLGFEEYFHAEEKLAAAPSSPPPEPNPKKDIEEELGRAAMTVFSWLYGIARSACGKGKIQPEHLPTLQALEKQTQANLTDLGKKVGVHPTTVKRQMKVLQKNGVGTVQRGRLRKKKAVIPELLAPGQEELSRCCAKMGSELKVRLDCPNGEGKEFTKALGRLAAVSKAPPH